MIACICGGVIETAILATLVGGGLAAGSVALLGCRNKKCQKQEDKDGEHEERNKDSSNA